MGSSGSTELTMAGSCRRPGGAIPSEIVPSGSATGCAEVLAASETCTVRVILNCPCSSSYEKVNWAAE